MTHYHFLMLFFQPSAMKLMGIWTWPKNFRNWALLYFTTYLSLGIDLDFINGPMLWESRLKMHELTIICEDFHQFKTFTIKNKTYASTSYCEIRIECIIQFFCTNIPKCMRFLGLKTIFSLETICAEMRSFNVQ